MLSFQYKLYCLSTYPYNNLVHPFILSSSYGMYRKPLLHIHKMAIAPKPPTMKTSICIPAASFKYRRHGHWWLRCPKPSVTAAVHNPSWARELDRTGQAFILDEWPKPNQANQKKKAQPLAGVEMSRSVTSFPRPERQEESQASSHLAGKTHNHL